MVSSALRSIAALIMVVSLVSCGPRGETITLDQVLANEKGRFASVEAKASSSKAAAQLAAIKGSLESLLAAAPTSDGSKVGADAAQIAETLSSIVGHAGYTSRPGLGELAAQYRSFTSSGDAKIDTAKTKLLVARTYSALAAELETAGFSL